MLEHARLLPYRLERLRNTILVSGYLGGWAFLDEDELQQLESESFWANTSLCNKLSDAAIIITSSNINNATQLYNGINKNLFLKPSLHMINVTNTCNYRCTYCHAGVSQGKDLMSKEVALKALKFIFRSSGQPITIEFQGGECLLNWKVVKLIVEKAREVNVHLRRNLHICMVSNLSLLNEEKLAFLTDNDVSICTSLDGISSVHDANRKTASGQATFSNTLEKIRFIQEYYKKRGVDKRVSILATITKAALNHPREIVDTYVRLGSSELHLRPVQNLGDASVRWDSLTYSPDEFYRFWEAAMEYILELNKQGIAIMERGAHNILCKILTRTDPLYVEHMNPTGMGRSSLLYHVNGDIYNSDEGRMIDEPLFVIGNVDQDPWQVLSGRVNISSWLSSFLELSCYHSPFRAWGGIHPVNVYRNQGTIIPNASRYDYFSMYSMQCRYLFEKISEDSAARDIFLEWSNRSIK